MYKTISTFSIIFIAAVAVYFVLQKTRTPTLTEKSKTDTYQQLKETNQDFKAGTEALNSGDAKAAIESFTLAKNTSQTKAEEAVAQYNIAAAKMKDGQRYPAVDQYLLLINDETLPARTRALAMNELYLLYRGYSDINILNQAFGKQDISKLSVEEIEHAYLAKANNLYPFAMSIHTMMLYEMKNNTKSAEEVQAIYDKYSPAFEKSLTELSVASGEKKYIVASMLGKVRVFIFMQKYNLISKVEVEKLLEATIEKSRAFGERNPEAFSILKYADYESAQDDIAKADALVAILSKMTLSTMVKENLGSRQSGSNYPGLVKLKIESKSTTTQAFFKSINW